MAKTRLNLLTDRKEQLYCKYFPITSKAKDVMVDGGERNNDKMADYIHELHEVDIGTGKSLADEIIYQQENINKLEKTINDMDSTLAKLTGIEYALYYEIVVKGVNVTRAVSNVAEEYDKDNQTIWKHHYKKIKKYVKKVTKFSGKM
jgi:hypothetical protein